MKRLAIVMGAGLALAAAPQAAAADGGPLPAVQGWPVSAPGGSMRYLTLPVRGGTLVEAVDGSTSAAEAWRTVPGAWGVVRATVDGATSGLSADGRTLVLAGVTNRWPTRRTRLLVLSPSSLRVRAHVRLRGFFTIDAISPDGRWLYLIHYTHGLARYEVRAYDLARDRLVKRPVIDPREPDEAMRGTPMSRVTSRGGRWAYTLYLRPSGAPFVHALDTVDRTARCIDLPTPHLNDPLTMSLSPDGGTLRFVSGGRVQSLVDTRTFTVGRPPSRRPPARRAAPKHAAGGGPPLWPAAVAALALLAGLARIRRRRAAYAG